MTDTLPVLRSRQASAVERRSPQGPSDALIEKARMLAAAGNEALPRHYANNPGACMMALDWSERNDVPLLDVIAHVAFLRGKPVVETVLQKRMAGRHGYRTRVVESSDTAATVAVIEPSGEEAGRYTYTIEKARAYGLADKDQYKADPEWMLIKRATTRALELHGPDESATMFADEATVEAELLPPAEPGDAIVATTLDGEVIHAEVVPEQPQGRAEAPTLNEVLDAASAKGIKPTSLKGAAAKLGFTVSAINELMDDAEALTVLADWIDQQ